MNYQRKNPLASALLYKGDNQDKIKEFVGEDFLKTLSHFKVGQPLWVVKNNGTEKIETYSQELFNEIFEPLVYVGEYDENDD